MIVETKVVIIESELIIYFRLQEKMFFSHHSKVMLSTSITSWRRKIEADSSNLEVLSVVRKRQVPFLAITGDDRSKPEIPGFAVPQQSLALSL